MKRPLFLVCLCLVIAVWFSFGETGGGEAQDQSDRNGSRFFVTGQVCQKDTEYFYLDSIILMQEAANPQQKIPFSEKLLCEYPQDMDDTKLLLGSSVMVSGTFDTFSRATNPGEFDMQKYYRSIGVGGRLRQVTLLEQGNSFSRWQETLYDLRRYFHNRLYQIFPQKEASVMCTMLLGEKKGLDRDIKELYQRNGIVHILSISGLHITLIGMSVYRLLRRTGMPVWLAALLGGGILVLYGIMTGMSVSAARAIGMYLLKLLAEVIGRTYDMLTALGIMAFLLVCGNPGYLENAGFYLSFGAVLGISVVYPALLPDTEKQILVKYQEHRWKRILGKLAKNLWNGLQQSALASLAITFVTLPVQLWFYYEVPTYSVCLNLMVLPLMGPVIIAGMLAMLVPGLGLVGTVDCLILGGYEKLCLWCESLPFSVWNPGRPKGWQMVAYYVVLGGMVAVKSYRKRQEHKARREHPAWQEHKARREHPAWQEYKILRKQPARRGGCLWQIVALTVAVLLLTIRLPKETMVTFLDVGQGDCICVQAASGEVYLFDCGSSSRSEVGEYVLKPFLKYFGISHIDAVFVSHFDSDHCNGVEELLARGNEWGITVGQVVYPGKIRAGDGWQSVDGWQESDGSENSLLDKGKQSVQFTCLHPQPGEIVEGNNEDSQCFYIELENGISILLTGDVEGVGEEKLLQELQRRKIAKVSVLKVAHHGSRYSTSDELLAQISPDIAVISCGKNNRYGHPHAETLKKLKDEGAKIMRTDQVGAVQIKSSDNQTIVFGY